MGRDGIERLFVKGKEQRFFVLFFYMLFLQVKVDASDVRELTRVLLQFVHLTDATGTRDLELTKRIEQRTASFVKGQSKEVCGRLCDAFREILSKRDRPVDSMCASKVMTAFPEFIRARIQDFYKKASRSWKDVLDELCRQTDVQFQRADLEKSYAEYQSAYDRLVDECFRLKLSNSDTLPNLVQDAVGMAKKLAGGFAKGETSPAVVGSLIASIFGVWTCLDVIHGGHIETAGQALRPHPTQVVSVMLLLGVGNARHANANGGKGGGGALLSKLLQVLTGEGKSVIAAGAAIALALIGYKVDIACYSPYLAKRDEEDFASLLKEFGVTNAVSYGDFMELCNRFIRRRFGKLRANTECLVRGEPLIQEAVDGHKRVLFIDEVDVLFSRTFVGGVYEPQLAFNTDKMVDMFRNIWQDRVALASQTKEQFVQGQLKTWRQACSEFKHLGDDFIKAELGRVYTSFLSVHHEKHEYKVHERKIGYVEPRSGRINCTLVSEYCTAFAAIDEERKGNIDANVAPLKCGISLCYACVSFAEIPKVYDVVLGVSGTLTSLTSFEKSLIDSYKNPLRISIPSMFVKKNLNGRANVKVCVGRIDATDTEGYFNNIRMSVEECIAEDRAVLVVFETVQRLVAYRSFISNNRYRKTVIESELTPVTPAGEVRHLIREAASRGHATYLTRGYGRGSDFICHDSGMQMKGVLVICTFFPDHPAEETQIKGRTCRQSDPGEFKWILFLNDLSRYDVAHANQLGNNIYQALVDRRSALQERQDRGQQQSMDLALTKHQVTFQYWQQLQKGSVSKARELLLELQSRGDLQLDLCFLMDCTGSMGPWIKETKQKIIDIVEYVQSSSKDMKMRLAFVGYRDFDHDDKRLVEFPFKDATKGTCEAFAKWLEGVAAIGGKDIPEDVAGGLERVTQLQWSSPVKLLIHFGDAPNHGSRFFTATADSKDNFPNGHPQASDPEKYVGFIRDRKIDYYFGEIDEQTRKMTDIFRTCYRGVTQPVFEVLTLKDNPSAFVSAVTDSVSKSLLRACIARSEFPDYDKEEERV